MRSVSSLPLPSLRHCCVCLLMRPCPPRGSISLLGIQFENIVFHGSLSVYLSLGRDCVNDEPAQPYGSPFDFGISVAATGAVQAQCDLAAMSRPLKVINSKKLLLTCFFSFCLLLPWLGVNPASGLMAAVSRQEYARLWTLDVVLRT